MTMDGGPIFICNPVKLAILPGSRSTADASSCSMFDKVHDAPNLTPASVCLMSVSSGM